VYGKVSRFKMDPFLALFDFPDPAITSEVRNITNVPLQGLFFLNSPLVSQSAEHLAERLTREAGADEIARIRLAYRLLYGREATDRESELGRVFLRDNKTPAAWREYAQALLSANDLVFVN
jgi:hypothetical protein